MKDKTERNWDFMAFIFAGFVLGFFAAGLITTLNYPLFIQHKNGTFIKNGTPEYNYLQYMDYNQKAVINFYDLQQVIEGNLCSEKYGNYITDITPESFRLQCCTNFSSCKDYVIINKQVKEIKIGG